MSFVYLASPYSHPLDNVRSERFRQAVAAADYQMHRGEIVFSPIAHSHPIDKLSRYAKRDHEFWMRQCIGMLRMADKLLVLDIDGWHDSKGVTQEIELARAMQIPVVHIDQKEL